jgi:hypothetical protein
MKMLIQMDKVHNIKWELSSQRIIANIIDEKSPDRSKRFADRLIEVLNKEPKRYANMKGIAGFNSDCINLGCSSRSLANSLVRLLLLLFLSLSQSLAPWP